MRKIKIYDLTFKRTAKFAPECYDIYNAEDKHVASLSLDSGLLALRVHDPLNFVCKWDVSDLNMFHSSERRDKWIQVAAKKYVEVRDRYGKQD